MLQQLTERFKGFKFEQNSQGNIFSVYNVDTFEVRTNLQNLQRIRSAYLFISTKMKGSDGVEFFYGILYQQGEQKLYRCRTWCQTEWNKLYFSGKTQEEVAQKFIDSNWKLMSKLNLVD
jgi:hypothetical protein